MNYSKDIMQPSRPDQNYFPPPPMAGNGYGQPDLSPHTSFPTAAHGFPPGGPPQAWKPPPGYQPMPQSYQTTQPFQVSQSFPMPPPNYAAPSSSAPYPGLNRPLPPPGESVSNFSGLLYGYAQPPHQFMPPDYAGLNSATRSETSQTSLAPRFEPPSGWPSSTEPPPAWKTFSEGSQPSPALMPTWNGSVEDTSSALGSNYPQAYSEEAAHGSSDEVEEDAAGQSPQKYKLEDVLDDLCSRFILSLPESEFETFERIFFALESSHWYYDDFYRDRDKNLPNLSLKEFAARMFEHTPLLKPYVEDFEKLFQDFRAYKSEVPSCGAAMINSDMTHVVLVQGWNAKGKWGFPKGKLAKDESEFECARREVFEETSYDCGPLMNEEDYLDATMQGRKVRIYCVIGVEENFSFAPRTRKEISKIEWHMISSLPDDYTHPAANRMWGIMPFSRRLKKFLSRKRKETNVGARPGSPVQHRQAMATPKYQFATSNPSNQSKKSAEKKKKNSGMSAKGPAPSSFVTGGRSRRDYRNDDVTFGSGKGGGLTQQEKDELFEKYISEVESRAEKDAEEEKLRQTMEEQKINARNLLTFAPDGEEEKETAEGQFISGMYIEEKGDDASRQASWKAISGNLLPGPDNDPLYNFGFDRAKILSCF